MFDDDKSVMTALYWVPFFGVELRGRLECWWKSLVDESTAGVIWAKEMTRASRTSPDVSLESIYRDVTLAP